MRISLILCTKNRVAEIGRFFGSLLEQTFTDFEVIIVDQNRDNRLESVIAAHQSKFTIRHYKQNATGLSRARSNAASIELK